MTTTQAQTEVRRIPYSTRFVPDPALQLGLKRVRSAGAAGERTLRYLVTLTNGHPTGRRLLSSTVTRNPRQRIVAIGQRSPAPSRRPSRQPSRQPSRRHSHADVQWPDADTGWGPGTWPDVPDGDEDDGQCDVLCLPWERSESYFRRTSRGAVPGGHGRRPIPGPGHSGDRIGG